MTIVMGAFSFQRSRAHGGFLAANIASLDDVSTGASKASALFRIDANLRDWEGIVIHHTGEPAGDPQSIHRQHVSWGYQGLGYHFLIGNGNGLGDGLLYAGYRWTEQLPGAHVAGPAGNIHNASSIGICLIGNGDRRNFTEKQIERLTQLINELRRELSIRGEDVHLHRDLTDATTSPGSFFPAAWLREQLLAQPR